MSQTITTTASKRETITASVTIYATFDRQDALDWFTDRVNQEEPEDRHSLSQRFGEFESEVSDDDNVRLYMNNGGLFDDYDVDHDEYFEHCFEAIDG